MSRPAIYLLVFLFACQSSSKSEDLEEAPDQVMVPTSRKADLVRASESEAPITDLKKNQPIKKVSENPAEAPAAKSPHIFFAKKSFNFGEIFHAEKVTHRYEFVNNGHSDLEIKNARASCGCTTPSYPFLPITPGEKGFIGVTYNSVGKQGFQRATIRVTTNDPQQTEVVLKLTGRVKVKPKEEYEKERAAKQKKN